MTASIEMKKVVDISIFLLIISAQHSLDSVRLIKAHSGTRDQIPYLYQRTKSACSREKFTPRGCISNKIRKIHDRRHGRVRFATRTVFPSRQFARRRVIETLRDDVPLIGKVHDNSRRRKLASCDLRAYVRVNNANRKHRISHGRRAFDRREVNCASRNQCGNFTCSEFDSASHTYRATRSVARSWLRVSTRLSGCREIQIPRDARDSGFAEAGRTISPAANNAPSPNLLRELSLLRRGAYLRDARVYRQTRSAFTWERQTLETSASFVFSSFPSRFPFADLSRRSRGEVNICTYNRFARAPRILANT